MQKYLIHTSHMHTEIILYAHMALTLTFISLSNIDFTNFFTVSRLQFFVSETSLLKYCFSYASLLMKDHKFSFGLINGEAGDFIFWFLSNHFWQGGLILQKVKEHFFA